MGNLLASGSILAAFFAGGVALFAPCCVVFLAPSYVAAAARSRRRMLLPLTFVFAFGLAAVLLPITLGIGLVSSTMTRLHPQLYYAGGALMLALAVLSLTGRGLPMPRSLRAPDTRGGAAGFFALGVFSGIASSCCAPVLAGVMTLSALAGTPFGAALLGLAYVFGMVFPLFVMALIWDKARLAERRRGKARVLRLRVAGRTLVTNPVNVAVAVVFAAMGGFVIYLADAGQMTGGPGFQVAVGRWLSRVFRRLEIWTAPVPQPLLGAGLLALVAVFVIAALRDRSRRDTEPDMQARTRQPGTPAPAATASTLAAGEDHCAPHQNAHLSDRSRS